MQDARHPLDMSPGCMALLALLFIGGFVSLIIGGEAKTKREVLNAMSPAEREVLRERHFWERWESEQQRIKEQEAWEGREKEREKEREAREKRKEQEERLALYKHLIKTRDAAALKEEILYDKLTEISTFPDNWRLIFTSDGTGGAAEFYAQLVGMTPDQREAFRGEVRRLILAKVKPRSWWEDFTEAANHFEELKILDGMDTPDHVKTVVLTMAILIVIAANAMALYTEHRVSKSKGASK